MTRGERKDRTIDRARVLRTVALAAVVAAVAVSVHAVEAMIEITVPLADATNDQVHAALLVAVARAVREAEAMGLSEVRLASGEVRNRTLVLTVLAADRMPARLPAVGGGQASGTPGEALTITGVVHERSAAR